MNKLCSIPGGNKYEYHSHHQCNISGKILGYWQVYLSPGVCSQLCGGPHRWLGQYWRQVRLNCPISENVSRKTFRLCCHEKFRVTSVGNEILLKYQGFDPKRPVNSFRIIYKIKDWKMDTHTTYVIIQFDHSFCRIRHKRRIYVEKTPSCQQFWFDPSYTVDWD